MIKYFDTEAAYAAATKSSSESQVALVQADKQTKFDGRNVVVGARSAKTGAVVLMDTAGAIHFVNLDTFVVSTFPASAYTYVGVVAIGIDHEDYRGKLVIIHKENASKQWSYIYSFKLTGYTLDGTDRSGVLKVYSAASTFANYTVNYNAEDIDGLVSQLNTFFRDTTNTVFQTQDWVAIKKGDEVHLQFKFTFADQRSCAGSDGFTLTANLMPGIVATTEMLRYNGQRTGEGTISNWARAIAYFSADLNNATYNPTTTQTSANAKRSYPICKPGYLGTSQYSGGEDRCAALREIYGEGEAGWLNFMRSLLAVRPTKYGVIGNKAKYGDSMRNTYLMAGETFTGQNGTAVPAFPAANYCAAVGYGSGPLKQGNWCLPDADTLIGILKTVKYNAVNDRNADPINKALNAIGGTALSNGSSTWSSSRCNASYAWYSNGNLGYMYYYYVYYTYLALPVTLLNVSDSEL